MLNGTKTLWPSWLLMAFLGLALVAFTGCPEDDDDASDDDTGDDDTGDDDTGDDDTGDDDTADDDTGDDDTGPDPECTYDSGAWISVVGSEDASGDASGYILDIKDYEYQFDGTTLVMRITSHTDFADTDPALMTDMYISDGNVSYTLTMDNVKPNPGPMQIWTSADGWAAPLPNPASYCHSDDESDSIVMGIDLADLDATFVGLDVLYGHTSVDLWSGYVDDHPDSSENVAFPLIFEPNITVGGLTWDDTTGGDGDGIVEAGETGALGLELVNSGYDATGANVSATITLDAGSTAAAAINSDTSAYNGGAAMPMDTAAPPDTPFEVQVDVGATAGQTLIFDVAVTDDDGNSWNLTTPPLIVGMENLLSDPVDSPNAFDIAGLSYYTDGTDLDFFMTSYTDHNADLEVDVFLDIDMDGENDYLISTYDLDSGSYATGGGIYEWIGSWSQVGQPTTLEWTASTNYVRYVVPRTALEGAVQFQCWAQSYDYYTGVDTAPDDTSDPANWGQAVIVNAPWILLDSYTWTESSGDGDGFVEAGETWDVALTVANQGTADSAATTGVLSSTEPNVTVDQANVDFGAITMGNTAAGDVAATVTIDGGAPDSASYVLDLEVTADAEVFNLAIPLGLGVVPSDTTANAPEVSAAGVYYGDTTGFVNDYSDPSNCTTYSATSVDVVYAINLAANQAFTAAIAYDAGGPDAVLYISDDAANPDTGCLAGADSNFDETETLNFTPTTAGLYYLIVDGYYTDDAGPYTLTLTF